MKFKILAGIHFEGDQAYRKGETVESKVDLAKRFGKDKFQRMADEAPIGPDFSDLPDEPTKSQILKMSVTQLKALAQRDGVSELLENITKKADMAEMLISHYEA